MHGFKLGVAPLAVLVSVSAALSAPPRVVEISPDDQGEVEPGPREIRVEFDQPMSHGGHSVVGGGESFPEIADKPRWINDRTMVIPVTLKPDHEYWFSINNERYQNFRNTNGEPAVPYPVTFWTTPGPDAVPLTSEQNQAAFEALERAIRTRYSHRDRLGLDWEKRLANFHDELIETESPNGFARVVARVLGAFKDKHISVLVGENRMGVYSSPVTPNVNQAVHPTLMSGWNVHSRAVLSGWLEDGTGYLAINSWGIDHKDSLEAAYEFIGSLEDAPGLILDVRMNGGGDELLARGIAGCFIDEPRLYATHKSVSEDGGFTDPSERWFRPNRARPKFRGPVAVLMGPVCMSSNEAFLLMMRQVPGATLIGGRSQGSSGNPKRHDLGNGVAVVLPSWIAMTPDGESFEGIGLKPDIEVRTTPEDLTDSDPVLSAALEWVRGGG